MAQKNLISPSAPPSDHSQWASASSAPYSPSGVQPQIVPLPQSAPQQVPLDVSGIEQLPFEPQKPAGVLSESGGCVASNHVGSLAISMVCLAAWISLIVCWQTESCQPAIAFPVILTFVTTWVYFLTCRQSDVSKYLQHMLSVDEVMRTIETYRSACPKIQLNCTCSHRTGGKNKRTVVTHSESVLFKVYQWRELCPPIELHPQANLTRIDVRKDFAFMDPATRDLFNQVSTNFQATNRHRDRRFSYTHEVELPSIEWADHLIAIRNPAEAPWWLNLTVFWMANALFLTYPYRQLFDAYSRRMEVAIVKQVSVFTPPGFQQPPMMPVQVI